MPTRHQPAYLVQEIPWEPDEQRPDRFVCLGAEFGASVRAFPDRYRAESLCAELEKDFRTAINPFLYGRDLAEQTSLPEGVFRDWLLDAGLTPPDPEESGGADWVSWWQRQQEAMTPLQCDRVWEALDRVRFFCVIDLARPTN